MLEKHQWSNIKVIRDRDFYENIGKYDQFVGGWDDPYDDPFDQKGKWYTFKKGNYESIIFKHLFKSNTILLDINKYFSINFNC